VIRRLSAAVAIVILTGTVASGCSTFTNNREAAKAGGQSLSVDEFETLAADIASAGIVTGFTFDESDELTGDNARRLLGEWITGHLLTAALAKAGTPVDDAARTKAEADLTKANSANWAKISDSTKQFLIEDQAAITLTSAGHFVSDADAKAAYEAGVATSKTLCIRYMAPADQQTADDLYRQLQDGADFATLAGTTDAGSVANGGIFADQTTGAECVDSTTINPAISDALAGVPAGGFSEPTALTGSDGSTATIIFLERPWDEVADTALPLVRTVLSAAYTPQAQAFKQAALTDGSKTVRVDSRYGTWDTTTLSVVPAR